MLFSCLKIHCTLFNLFRQFYYQHFGAIFSWKSKNGFHKTCSSSSRSNQLSMQPKFGAVTHKTEKPCNRGHRTQACTIASSLVFQPHATVCGFLLTFLVNSYLRSRLALWAIEASKFYKELQVYVTQSFTIINSEIAQLNSSVFLFWQKAAR